ncbi:spore germination protein [Alteribacillus sp. HJP-4]|uniref:spore germination protein n=1 Tax=Alteribacillus sp. HJP-4 TaxID=2775394 RepID=UPI0035CCE743
MGGFLKRIRRKSMNKGSQHHGTDKDIPSFISKEPRINVEIIKNTMQNSSDVLSRSFHLFGTDKQAAIVYIEVLVNMEDIQEQILSPLLVKNPQISCAATSIFKDDILSVGKIEIETDMAKVVHHILNGKTALFIDGGTEAAVIDTTKVTSRTIEEPVQEALIRGPRDGFTENLNSNLALIRARMKSFTLTINTRIKGERTRKSVAVIYDHSLARQEIVEEVMNRLSTIEMDDFPDTGFIEQCIEDESLSLFPQVQSTERPDKVVAAVLEGRVVIAAEGTPFVLIVPVTFSQFIHSPEDYYERWYIGTFLRILRYFGVMLAVFLPALYVALTSYHQGLLPTELALSIAAAREGIPFPSFLEALLMEITLELLREAGVRLPTPLGQTVGLIGGIIIGEAAVSAGIVNPLMVIVVAMTAVSNFIIPSYSMAITLRILRFIVLMFALVLGMYGIILFFILLMAHLVSLKSFGIPYFTPFSPLKAQDWKDTIFRFPIPVLNKRPQTFHPKDKVRLRKETKQG